MKHQLLLQRVKMFVTEMLLMSVAGYWWEENDIEGLTFAAEDESLSRNVVDIGGKRTLQG